MSHQLRPTLPLSEGLATVAEMAPDVFAALAGVRHETGVFQDKRTLAVVTQDRILYAIDGQPTSYDQQAWIVLLAGLAALLRFPERAAALGGDVSSEALDLAAEAVLVPALLPLSWAHQRKGGRPVERIECAEGTLESAYAAFDRLRRTIPDAFERFQRTADRFVHVVPAARPASAETLLAAARTLLPSARHPEIRKIVLAHAPELAHEEIAPPTAEPWAKDLALRMLAAQPESREELLPTNGQDLARLASGFAEAATPDGVVTILGAIDVFLAPTAALNGRIGPYIHNLAAELLFMKADRMGRLREVAESSQYEGFMRARREILGEFRANDAERAAARRRSEEAAA